MMADELEDDRIIKLPPRRTFCEHFRYKKGAEQLYRCKQSCMMSNDIFELFEECYRLDYKYAIREKDRTLHLCKTIDEDVKGCDGDEKQTRED